MVKIRKCQAVVTCIWILGSCLMCSVLTNPSLWGKKAVFMGLSCHWQLSETCTVPPLEELSVCTDIWRQIRTSDWTAFVYKKPGELRSELGLAGTGGNLKAWLFGREWVIAYDLPLLNWHTVCLTWSSHTGRFQVVVNGTVCLSSRLNDSFPSRLASGGMLTLGASHSFIGDVLVVETGTNFIGEMTLFRMWGQELSAQQLSDRKCASGDIVTWSVRDWDFSGCPAITDNLLKCEWSKYIINMKLSIAQNTSNDVSQNETRAVVMQWLESILPASVSVNSMFLSTLSQVFQADSHVHENTAETKEIIHLSTTEAWLRCRLYMTVNPAAPVDETQAELWTELITTYNHSAHIILRTDPASINILPVDFADQFFRVYMNFVINGSVEDPVLILQLWVHQTLGAHELTVLNFKLTRNSNYDCTFQVQAKAAVNVTETRMFIFQLLARGFANDSVTIHIPADQISILLLEPGLCPEDTTQTVYGLYSWPPMQAQETYIMMCEKGHETAVRLCKLDDHTDAAIWNPPDLAKCERIMTDIEDLENVTVTTDNSAEVVDMIENLLSNQTDLSSSQLNTVLQKLSEVTDIGAMTTYLGDSIINVVSSLFDSTPYLTQATNKVLSITEQLGNRMELPGACHNTTVPSLALQLVDVVPVPFRGLTFGVSSYQTGLPPEIFLNHNFEHSSIYTVASISLPIVLEHFFPQSNKNRSRVQFHFYGTQNLFQDTFSDLMLNSYVVSASVTNASVNNLTDPVVVTLHHLLPKEDQHRVQCVYWNLKKNGERGGWDDSGCKLEHTNVTHTSCLCLHLTHFGVLLDVSKTRINPRDDMILTVISYLGCGVSSVFLSITLLTYIVFGKLRCDYPSKILINLSVALLGLNMLFLVNSWLASYNIYGLCITVAAVLHYFFLASFTWMALEAINMYLAFVKVFNVYVSSYILKFCALGWGLPLMVVSIVLVVDKDCYGNTNFLDVASAEHSSSFCWVRGDVTFYVTVVAFVALVLVGNAAVLGVVLVQIRRMQSNRVAGGRARALRDLRVVASLTFLLGLTWVLAFLAWGPVQVPLFYLFAFLNSLQGFFIFLFHCLMKENVRKQWRIHLCCGEFKLTDYSAQSRTLSQGGRVESGKVSNVPSESTSERKISDSSGTGQKDEGWKKGPGGLL